MKNYLLSVFVCVLLLTVIPQQSGAAVFSNIVSFGDSLTDNGNIMRYTDGDIWVESLANHLGVSLLDYAYGGATTGAYNANTISGQTTGLLWQVDETKNYKYDPSSITDTSLVTLWAGANDFLQSIAQPTQDFSIPTAMGNMTDALETLYGDGARNFLVPNLPNIGGSPALLAQGGVASGGATAWTEAFNSALAATLSIFEIQHDVNLYGVDIFKVFDACPVGDLSAWEVTSDRPIWTGTDTWGELFWFDGFHPSSIGHQLIYQEAAMAIVPEPATALLFGVGILGLAGTQRRKRLAS